MSRFTLSAALLSCLLVPVAGHAQVVDPSKPVFTATTVHPVGTTDLVSEPPAAGRPARPMDVVARGRTPRAHAQELADVFRLACLESRGDAIAVADWALNHGFTPVAVPPDEALTKDMKNATAYARELDAADSLMLVVGDSPTVCSAVSKQAIDGPRLRDKVQQLAAAWEGGLKAPQPVMSTDINGRKGEDNDVRMVSYRFAGAGGDDTLFVVAPRAVGGRMSLLTLRMADGSPPAR